MVVRVGEDLGALVNHELTRTTARVRVLIDGLKPLVKEAIVDFDSGEEISITLEYENLEMHCSVCFSLLHQRNHCPMRLVEVTEARDDNANVRREQAPRNYELERTKVSMERPSRSHDEMPSRRETNRIAPSNLPLPGFQERLDRHGNPFGDRVSTKQTRNPPPASRPETGEVIRGANDNIMEETKDPSYASPPYSRNRTHTGRQVNQRRDLFPRKSDGQWRPKLVVVPNPPEEM